MVNLILLRSSLIIMIPQVLWKLSVASYHWHCIISIITALTSILNHGLSDSNKVTYVFTFIDRVSIFVASIINIFLCIQPNLILCVVACIMYFLAKVEYNPQDMKRSNFWHIILHIIGSSSNVFVVLNLN